MKKQNETPKKSPKRAKHSFEHFKTIDHIEQIVEQANGSKFSPEFLEKVTPHTTHIAQKLDINPTQAALMALFVNLSNDRNIELSDLCRPLECTNVAMIRLMNQIDGLVTKRYLCSKEHNGKQQFSVPLGLVEALRKEEPYLPLQCRKLDKDSLFDAIEKTLKARENDELPYEMMVEDLLSIIDNNQHLTFCKQIQEYKCGDDTVFVVFVAFCHLLVNNDDNRVGFNDFIDLFPSKACRRYIQCAMKESSFELIDEYGLIEPANDEGFDSRECFCLTKKARQEFLLDYELKESQTRESNAYVVHSSLSEKSLYYNERERAQIEKPTSLLINDHFLNVQSRLEQGGLRRGFACLFYGSPGTGKTETVYQIARKTGRDLMVADVSQIKSCWVGESEKNTKELFNRYRRLCQKSDTIPILLFNEADAVIGTRMEGSTNSVDKMNNSMQNIILQEMESLEGIMIATTNLTQNLDKAFERRFLYKIEFDKPSLEAKRAIWRTMLPTLSDDEAAELARAYEFSGGQIENVARKRLVEAIVEGKEPSLDTLHDFCRVEQLYKTDIRRPIGYAR